MTQNHAGQRGGGIYDPVDHNVASNRGGGLDVHQGLLTLAGGTVTLNVQNEIVKY